MSQDTMSLRYNIVLLFAIILLYSCTSPNTTGDTMKITSPAFAEGAEIPSEYTCDGKNSNPQLDFAEVPAAAKSIVLIMDDPDVPAEVRPERMWDHWVVFNIPPETNTVSAGQNPPGIAGKNSQGTLEYGGPCPPTQFEPKRHRYFFKLYALDIMLDLPEGSTKAQVEQAMQGHIVEQAQLMGKYQKKG